MLSEIQKHIRLISIYLFYSLIESYSGTTFKLVPELVLNLKHHYDITLRL